MEDLVKDAFAKQDQSKAVDFFKVGFKQWVKLKDILDSGKKQQTGHQGYTASLNGTRVKSYVFKHHLTTY